MKTFIELILFPFQLLGFLFRISAESATGQSQSANHEPTILPLDLWYWHQQEEVLRARPR